MKKIILIFAFILLLTNISAIIITEFESNPAGDDARNEWIEFYSENEINLSGYKIINNDGDEIELNFSFEGYYVYVFEKQWLDNSDEKVYLYNGENLIDETEIFADSLNNDFTWQFCEEWIFLNSTRGQKCRENEEENQNKENITEDEKDENEDEEEQEDEKEEGSSKNIKETRESIEKTNYEKEKIRDVISASKTIKSEEDTENLDKSIYASYGLVAFCLLLLVLFVKNKGKYKNEFR